MGFPPPSSRIARPALTKRDELPSGTAMEPKRTEAEMLYMDGSWHAVQILGWLRLDVTHRQPITNRFIFWLVQLRLETGEEAWFEHNSLNLRPVKASSSSARET